MKHYIVAIAILAGCLTGGKGLTAMTACLGQSRGTG